MVRCLSTASASHWWNTGVCVASSSSVRNTRPGEAMYSGTPYSSSARTWSDEVCVRSTMFEPTKPAASRACEPLT